MTRDKTRKKAGMLIFDGDLRLLIVKSKWNNWGIPQGFKKREEDFEECALRELQEETGLVVDPVLPFNDTSRRYKLFVYFYKPQDSPIHIELCNKELENYMFVDKATFESMLNSEPFTHRFKEVGAPRLLNVDWPNMAKNFYLVSSEILSLEE